MIDFKNKIVWLCSTYWLAASKNEVVKKWAKEHPDFEVRWD